MTHSPLVIWRLTDGKPGHMQQTLGLVQALAARTACNTIDIDLTHERAGWLDLLLGRFAPGVARHRPDLIVGAGHATHIALLAARRAAGGRAVALMKPSLPVGLFDFVITPEHDGLSESTRVINTIGVLNPMQAAAKQPDSLLFLIGGPSKHVLWDDAAVLRQVEALAANLRPARTGASAIRGARRRRWAGSCACVSASASSRTASARRAGWPSVSP